MRVHPANPEPSLTDSPMAHTGGLLWREGHRRSANQQRDRAPRRPHGTREDHDQSGATNARAARRLNIGVITAEIKRLGRRLKSGRPRDDDHHDREPRS